MSEIDFLKLADPIVEILKVGLTGFGAILAALAFYKLNDLSGRILDATKPPTDEVVQHLLQAFKINQGVAVLFFFVAAIVAVLSYLRPPPPLYISIVPTQGGISRMVVVTRDGKRLQADKDDSMAFVVDSKTTLLVDVNEVVQKLNNSLAVSTARLAAAGSALNLKPSDGGPDADH